MVSDRNENGCSSHVDAQVHVQWSSRKLRTFRRRVCVSHVRDFGIVAGSFDVLVIWAYLSALFCFWCRFVCGWYLSIYVWLENCVFSVFFGRISWKLFRVVWKFDLNYCFGAVVVESLYSLIINLEKICTGWICEKICKIRCILVFWWNFPFYYDRIQIIHTPPVINFIEVYVNLRKSGYNSLKGNPKMSILSNIFADRHSRGAAAKA